MQGVTRNGGNWKDFIVEKEQKRKGFRKKKDGDYHADCQVHKPFENAVS